MCLRLTALLMMLPWFAAASAQPDGTAGVDATVTRVGEYVERYYDRAQSLIVDETVALQPFGSDFSSQGFPRRLVYELRVEWDEGGGAASAVRTLLRSAGPTLGTPDKPDCLDPRGVSPEPLAFLLPQRREEFAFTQAGRTQMGEREVLRIDFTPHAPGEVHVDWDGDCGKIDMPRGHRGRLWVDEATSAILRLDERLVGLIDIPAPRDRSRVGAPLWFTVERADTSIHYEPVTFKDPHEVLMLPSRIETVSIIRNSGVPRLRTTRTFTNYRRFVTEGRIVQ